MESFSASGIDLIDIPTSKKVVAKVLASPPSTLVAAYNFVICSSVATTFLADASATPIIIPATSLILPPSLATFGVVSAKAFCNSYTLSLP
jgi:hypothetical protein